MNETPGKTSPDDIDLLLLLQRFLFFLRNYRWLFIAAIVLGIATGICMYIRLPYVYSSGMIVHPSYLTNQEEIQVIKEWNNLLKKKEYSQLSQILGCNESLLSRLKEIEADEIQKVFSTANPHGFIITVTVTDNSILEELQAGIIHGFENNEYIGTRLAARKETLKDLINKTSVEIQKLDSTKTAVEDIIKGKGKSSSTLIVDGSTITRQLLDMNEKLLGYQNELKFTTAIQVLQGFNKFNKPSNPKLFPWLVMGLAFFLVIAYICALLISIRKKLKVHIENGKGR